MNGFKKTFGERVKTQRKKVGIKTQRDLAQKMNLSEETIKNWEQGRTVPEMTDMIKLCDLLKCDTDYLLGRIDASTHDFEFITKETGLSEAAILGLQDLWIKHPSPLEMVLKERCQTTQELKNLAYRFENNHCEENFIAALRGKQGSSRALKALNILLTSYWGKYILSNLESYLNFEYIPSTEEIEQVQEINKLYGKHFKAVIKSKDGYIDAEYLNTAFLVAIQNNLYELKKEYSASKT